MELFIAINYSPRATLRAIYWDETAYDGRWGRRGDNKDEREDSKRGVRLSPTVCTTYPAQIRCRLATTVPACAEKG